VPSTILDDDIAHLEMNSLGVIKLQPNFTLLDYCVVHSIRFMHGRIFFFKVIG